jgi:spoIIIJ-associated protein
VNEPVNQTETETAPETAGEEPTSVEETTPADAVGQPDPARDESDDRDENAAEENAAEENAADENAADENAADEGSDDDAAEDGAARPVRRERLEQEGDIAADYLEELLEISDLDGDLDMDVEGDRATVSIVGANLPQLVGDEGEVLEALQELTRLAVYRETGERSRLMLDVSGHRAERRTALEEQASGIVAQVKGSGERARLEPMTPFERKVVHDVVAAAGLKSESEGTEPRRYVVVLPA